MTRKLVFYVLSTISLIPYSRAGVTLYNQYGQFTLGTANSTSTAIQAEYTEGGTGPYDPLVLDPPTLPDPRPANSFNIQLSDYEVPGLSHNLEGNFFGFSIEFSVVTQVVGKDSLHLHVPFLNLIANLVTRGGKVQVRVGGNTQDFATLVESTPDGRILEKYVEDSKNPTQTPPTIFTPEVIYMLGNVSSLVNVEWFLGVPLNESENLRLGIAEVGQAVLGDKLKGLQVGNEPDLYQRHGHRPEGYSPYDYDGEFGKVAAALRDIGVSKPLVGPSIALADWTPQQVWDTGFATNHEELEILSVENYPTNNCFSLYGVGTYISPEAAFPGFLTHRSGQGIVQPFLDSARLALSLGKPFYMFETNTASCGGFPGVSNSFGAALWGVDYALQMAYSNFSAALFHVGGQSVYYNPFTAAPTNVSTFRGWTIGSMYYSALIVAEALGPSGQARILDLFANSDSEFTPGYVIYENGRPARLLLINYISDSSGESAYTAHINIGGQNGEPGTVPASVRVKYFIADSVSQTSKFTWAGQTFGGIMASDGRPTGNEDIQTINCDVGANTCSVTVPAPGAALVFLTDDSIIEEAPMTFATTAVTRLSNTATIDPAVVATSNGHGGRRRQMLGSTSRGSVGSAAGITGLLSNIAKILVCATGITIIGLLYL